MKKNLDLQSFSIYSLTYHYMYEASFHIVFTITELIENYNELLPLDLVFDVVKSVWTSLSAAIT